MDFEAPIDEDPKKLRDDVGRDPTDLRLRFRLGAALSIREKYHEAIPELEKGMASPHVRLHAMKLLIEAYEATGQWDLAARLREQFSKESGDDSGSAAVFS